MILSAVQFTWNFILFFAFVVMPLCVVHGFVKAHLENKEKEVEEKVLKTENIAVEEVSSFAPVIESYRTIKKEAGSYQIIGPDNTEAIVVRVEVPNEKKQWVAALAVKNGKSSDRVATKKEAVALAIELLKEHKENTK